MLLVDQLQEIVRPVASIMPYYYMDAADINGALDHGVANCAARVYAAGLLMRQAFPNKNLYEISFGFSPIHGGLRKGANGQYIEMGHAVTRMWVPEMRSLIIESDNEGRLEVVFPEDKHDDYLWNTLGKGYINYLRLAGMGEVRVRRKEILGFLNRGVERWQDQQREELAESSRS